MNKILVGAALALSLSAMPAMAKGKPAGRGNDKHEDKSDRKDNDKDKERDEDRTDRDRKKDWGNHDREHARVADNGRPPGWDKGKKTGWGNCDVPPGQAKKQGCNSTRATRPIIVSRRDRDDKHRPSTRHTTTTTTTTTTTSTTSSKHGTHPFSPVLRQKQQGGSTDSKNPRQSVK